jgi:predicted Zn-dependent peptidase
MYLDEPERQVQELLNEVLWPNHPLGRPIEGTDKTLNGLGRRQLVGYLREHYVTGSTLVMAAGQITHSQALRATRRYAGRLQPGPRQQTLPFSGKQRAPQVLLRTKKTEQTQIALGIRTCSRHDPRRHALRILNAILGENMSSRLFQVVREDRGLAYSIYSTPSFFEDTGDFAVYAGLDTDNISRTMRLITRELRRCKETLPSAAEMRRARDYAIGQIDLASESTETQMNWLGEHLLGYNRVFSLAEIKDRLAAVTAAEVRAAARDFFHPESSNLALVSPLKSDRGLLPLLDF